MPPFVESFLMNDWLSTMFCISKLLVDFIVATHSSLKRAYCVPWLVWDKACSNIAGLWSFASDWSTGQWCSSYIKVMIFAFSWAISSGRVDWLCLFHVWRLTIVICWLSPKSNFEHYGKECAAPAAVGRALSRKKRGSGNEPKPLGFLAEVHGNRTHLGGYQPPTLDLKSRRPTRTCPLPLL